MINILYSQIFIDYIDAHCKPSPGFTIFKLMRSSLIPDIYLIDTKLIRGYLPGSNADDLIFNLQSHLSATV